jgi:hypothetical protein
MIPMVAMLAFAVDMGYITHTKNELQAAADAAADAAALAGANRLIDSYVTYHLPKLSNSEKTSVLNSAVASSKTAARTYASYNAAAEVNSLKLLDTDIELGFTATNGTYTPLPEYKGYPNTVKVVMRRDASANGALPMFFARVMGINTVDLNVTAAAAIYNGQVDGFRSPSSVKSRILPMTYDVEDWKRFLKGEYASWMNVDNDASGFPRVSIYPTNEDRGNFGQLSLNQANDGASTIRGWIHDGVDSFDLQASYTKGLLPLSSRNSNSFPDWKGNPGLKDSTIQAVGDHVRESYLLPLFKALDSSSTNYAAGQGQGSNYYYNIVAFVGVKISEVDSQGGTKSIKVQPTSLIDPNALLASTGIAQPPGGSTTVTTTFVGAKLVR